MPWFEATDDIQISPNRYVEPGDRFEYPYRAGKALVAASRAEWSEAPTSGDAGGAGTDETPTDGGDGDDPEPEPDDGSEGQETPVDALDFTDVDGIGEETADEIDAWLADEGIETVAELEDAGLDALPGVGPSTAEDIREAFEAL